MKEWYMTGQTPDAAGGFETDAISEYAQSNFTDVMMTEFSDTVTLCNYDLSEQKEIQCIIQNNTADTLLKTMERQILCPIGTIKAGMYILYHGNYWIVTGLPDNNKSYEKSTLSLCQYQLRWQKSDGVILERWCNMMSAAKYDVGESGNSTLLLTTNNFTILIPNDEDSMTIESKRVFIDRNTKYPKKVFKITRNDDSLYDYGENGGIISLIANKTELIQENDNTNLMICDYICPAVPPSPDENLDETTVFLTIDATKDTLKIGGNYTIFKGHVTNKNKNITNDVGTFTINSRFANKLITDTAISNQIKIKISDTYTDLVGEVFELIFTVGEISVSKIITVED